MEDGQIVSGTFFGTKISVMEAGTFRDNDGVDHDVPAGVRVAIGNTSVRLAAIQWLAIRRFAATEEFQVMFAKVVQEERNTIDELLS